MSEYKYTKVEITDAAELVPGTHWIEVGTTKLEVVHETCSTLPGAKVWVMARSAEVFKEANWLLDCDCDVYTREKVEPMEFEGELFWSNPHQRWFIEAPMAPRPSSSSTRFHCTEIMDNQD